MAKLNLGLLVLVLVVGNVAGCKPSIEADLSPNGRTAAITRDRGLLFRDTSGQASDRLVSLKGPESPVYSPDGKWVVVASGKKTYLVEESTGYLSLIPSISPPYAWKPDSSELCGTRANQAVVVHVASKEVCRTYALPENPEHAIWLGTQRDLAFTRGHRLHVVTNGKVQSLNVDGSITSIAQKEKSQTIVLTEMFVRSQPKSIPASEVRIEEVPVDLKDPPKQIWTALDKEAVDIKDRFCITVASLVSPDGARVANVGFVDQSEPGLLKEFEALGGFDETITDAKLKKRLQALQKQMHFAAVVTCREVGPSVGPPVKLLKQKSDQLTDSFFWSKDSRKFGVFLGEKLVLLPIP